MVSLNLHRRHLDESQRAKVAAKLANMERGDNQHGGSANLQTQVSQSRAAELLNVGTRTVAAAAKVERESPEVFEQIGTGKYANLQTYAHTRARVGDTTTLRRRDGGLPVQRLSVSHPATRAPAVMALSDAGLPA